MGSQDPGTDTPLGECHAVTLLPNTLFLLTKHPSQLGISRGKRPQTSGKWDSKCQKSKFPKFGDKSPWKAMEPPASPTLLYIGDRWRVRKNWFQWKVGTVVETGRARKLGKSDNIVRGMALDLQLQSWLWAILCFSLPVGAASRWHTGEPMDSAGVGGVPLEPEHLDMIFEFLWTGLKLDTMGRFHLRDEELASTRPGRRLVLFLQRWVPSTLAGTEQQLRRWQQAAPLSPKQFQQLLLTSVACVYHLHAALEGEERGRWAELFSLLGQEILQDLCKNHCPQGQTPLLSPWAFLKDPSPQHSSP